MQFDQLKRRDFITFIGGAATWPIAARAQRPEKVPKIGYLSDETAGPHPFNSYASVIEGLRKLGCQDRQNIEIVYRYAAGKVDRLPPMAAELAALPVDIIFSVGTVASKAAIGATKTIPIVFSRIGDPVRYGLVASLPRPGGNATGFTPSEYGIGVKWLELLKQIAPGVTRAADLRDASIISGAGTFGAIQGVAPSLGVVPSPIDVRDASEIERAITAFARFPNSGLIVTGSAGATVHRNLIITLAARHKLPAVYFERSFITSGGLISYGVDYIDQYRQAADCVDRILKGEKPADLPVQNPTKYETVINLKTAKALGLEMPASVLVRADEMIE